MHELVHYPVCRTLSAFLWVHVWVCIDVCMHKPIQTVYSVCVSVCVPTVSRVTSALLAVDYTPEGPAAV